MGKCWKISSEVLSVTIVCVKDGKNLNMRSFPSILSYQRLAEINNTHALNDLKLQLLVRITLLLLPANTINA